MPHEGRVYVDFCVAAEVWPLTHVETQEQINLGASAEGFELAIDE